MRLEDPEAATRQLFPDVAADLVLDRRAVLTVENMRALAIAVQN